MGQKNSKGKSKSQSPSQVQDEVNFESKDEVINYIRQHEQILKNVFHGIESFPDVINNEAFAAIKHHIDVNGNSASSFPATRRASNMSALENKQLKKPKGTFDTSKQKFEAYICYSETAKDEAKQIRANFEKKIKVTSINLSSSYDSIEQEIAESGCVIFVLSEGCLSHEKSLFVLRCIIAYDKKMLVVHVRESCAFPKFEEQPSEFKETLLMEDVFTFSPDTATKVYKEIEAKLQLPERKLDRGGLLVVKVVKGENLATSEIRDVKKIYCILEFDQNGVVLDAKRESDPVNPEWKSKAKFDVSRPSLEFSVSVWCTTTHGTDVFLGTCRPTVVFDTKSHQETFQLTATSPEQKVTGSLVIKTTYTKPETKSKMKIEDFDLLKVIGKGTLGKVMQVRKKDTERIYAMKIIRKADVVERNEIDHIVAERQVLAQIQHPFIVNLKFSFQTEDKLYLVLSFVNGGELFLHLQENGPFDEYRSKFYTAELLLALEYLHSYNIIYRDVKPENILLDYSGHIALCDFGLCKMHMTKNEKTNTFCGTPEYLAPELLEGDGYTKVVDWWTLGILLYEMLAGLPPFYSENINEMYRRTVEEDLTFPPSISPVARDLLTKLLEKDPTKRLGANSAEEIKQHPFFHDIDWVKLMHKRITPPFKPSVSSGLDTSNFDPEVTKELPTDSYVEGSKLSDSVQNKFKGFTYVNDSKMTYANTPIMPRTILQ